MFGTSFENLAVIVAIIVVVQFVMGRLTSRVRVSFRLHPLAGIWFLSFLFVCFAIGLTVNISKQNRYDRFASCAAGFALRDELDGHCVLRSMTIVRAHRSASRKSFDTVDLDGAGYGGIGIDIADDPHHAVVDGASLPGGRDATVQWYDGHSAQIRTQYGTATTIYDPHASTDITLWAFCVIGAVLTFIIRRRLPSLAATESRRRLANGRA